MKTLLVATAATPPGVREAIARDRHHRVDYLELAGRLGADCIDYGVLPKASPRVQWLEETTRLDLRLARYVKNLVRDQGYECVFSLSERVGLPLTYQLDPSVKHVVLVHHAMSTAKLSALRVARAAKRWHGMFAVSPAEANALDAALGLRPGSVKPLLAAVDTDFYRPPSEDIPLSERDHIQSLGSSHRDYGTLFRALHRTPVACEIRLGSTWVRNKVSFEGERIPDCVRLKSFIPPHELRQWYARQRFAVITLQDDTQWSAGCTSVQHAQAMGRAVIATDRPGLHSYMLDGETGILVRPGDDKDLAEAIDFLWRNPERADTMGRRGREWITQTCSMDHWLDRVTAILDDVPKARVPKAAGTVLKVGCEARFEQ
jgi:hypothetical protein